MIKNIFKIREQDYTASFGLLLLRLVVGIAFIYHGWDKIQNPFGWIPAEAPLKVHSIFQFLAALSEFGGGIALILGLLNSLTNIGIGFTMLVAVYLHMIVLKDPFVNSKGGGSYELALVYLVISILLYIVGPGKLSVDRLLFGEKK